MRRLILVVLAVTEIIAFVPSAMSQTLGIIWEVENRFRFYRNPSTFKFYAQAAGRKMNEKQWILATERALEAQYKLDRSAVFPDIPRPSDETDLYRWNGWASLTRDETCWDRQNFKLTEREGCEDYVSPVSHRVILKAEHAEPGAQCLWNIEAVGEPKFGDISLWRRRARANARLNSETRPCEQTVTAEVPWAEDSSAYAAVSVKLVSGGVQRTSDVVKILVRDLLVLGMGDSFAAGVGNPDKPAQIDWRTAITYAPLVGTPTTRGPLPVRVGGDANDVPTSSVASAQSEWQDIRCFRSQYGPQFRTALHLAVAATHTAVTYLDLSCNGARIIEGLLSSKLIDKGYRRGIKQPTAQLGLASRLLCADKSNLRTISYTLRPSRSAEGCESLDARAICEFSDRNGKIDSRYQNDPGLSQTFMRVCGGTFRRTIDVLLLSIGGNDIGFAPMVGDVILDDRRAVAYKVIRKLGAMMGALHDGQTGMERLKLLKSKYDVLDRAISEFLPLRPGKKPIFLTAYPLPVDGADGKLCGVGTNVENASEAMDLSLAFSEFAANKVKEYRREKSPHERLAAVLDTTCTLNLYRFAWFDGGSDQNDIISTLTRPGALCAGKSALASHAKGNKLNWQYVASLLVDFSSHGFCAMKSRPETQDALSIPLHRHGGTDNPWEPSFESMRPYSERSRWVRTPNDAFVITNWAIGYKLNDFINLMAGGTTTAMHPSAEGYAAMADGIFVRIRNFLCTERNVEFGGDALCKQ